MILGEFTIFSYVCLICSSSRRAYGRVKSGDIMRIMCVYMGR